MKEDNERAVVVCTKERGVFFGYIVGGATTKTRIHLKRGRNCIYWPVECRGFVGLAKKGPLAGAKVGPAADMDLFGITAVLACSDEAVTLWESEPWD